MTTQEFKRLLTLPSFLAAEAVIMLAIFVSIMLLIAPGARSGTDAGTIVVVQQQNPEPVISPQPVAPTAPLPGTPPVTDPTTPPLDSTTPGDTFAYDPSLSQPSFVGPPPVTDPVDTGGSVVEPAAPVELPTWEPPEATAVAQQEIASDESNCSRDDKFCGVWPKDPPERVEPVLESGVPKIETTALVTQPNGTTLTADQPQPKLVLIPDPSDPDQQTSTAPIFLAGPEAVDTPSRPNLIAVAKLKEGVTEAWATVAVRRQVPGTSETCEDPGKWLTDAKILLDRKRFTLNSQWTFVPKSMEPGNFQACAWFGETNKKLTDSDALFQALRSPLFFRVGDPATAPGCADITSETRADKKSYTAARKRYLAAVSKAERSQDEINKARLAKIAYSDEKKGKKALKNYQASLNTELDDCAGQPDQSWL